MPSKLRTEMFKQSVSQAELARRCKVSRQYMSLLMKSEQFSEEMKNKIANALGKEIQQLWK